jgi:hypothetical protein
LNVELATYDLQFEDERTSFKTNKIQWSNLGINPGEKRKAITRTARSVKLATTTIGLNIKGKAPPL